MVRAVWLILLTFMTATAWGAQVFRSVDSQGDVSYSDRPGSADAESIYIATAEPASVAPVRTPAPETAEPAEETEEVEQVQREPTSEERAEDRARNCAIAQQRHDSYLISHRLYRTTPDGEREYLDDAELGEARARAAADVQEWCD